MVVAINGDYFDPPTGYPQNGMLQSGWYLKRYNDYEGWSGFAWLTDRSIFYRTVHRQRTRRCSTDLCQSRKKPSASTPLMPRA